MQAADLFQEISFPLKVFMYDYDSPSNDWHRHNGFYELVIVCSGTAKNELPGETELVAPGTIFMMPPGALHRYTAIRHFRHYNVLFSEELMAFCGKAVFSVCPGQRKRAVENRADAGNDTQ